MSDNKLPSCVAFALRYCERLRAKLEKIGCDWMTPKVQKDWILAGEVFYLLHCLIDYGDEKHDYKLFFLLGYKLIDLVSSVNFALNNLDDEKKEN